MQADTLHKKVLKEQGDANSCIRRRARAAELFFIRWSGSFSLPKFEVIGVLFMCTGGGGAGGWEAGCPEVL